MEKSEYQGVGTAGIIGAILEASANTRPWKVVLDRVRQRLGATGVALAEFDF